MNTESFYALLRDIWASLERILIGLGGYINGLASEKSKLLLNATQTRLEAIQQKETLINEIKKYPESKLNSDTVDDN